MRDYIILTYLAYREEIGLGPMVIPDDMPHFRLWLRKIIRLSAVL